MLYPSLYINIHWSASLPSPPPWQVQVVSLLVSTADQDRRHAILRRAAAGGGALDSALPAGAEGGGGAWNAASPPPVLVPAAPLQSIVAQADDVIAVSRLSDCNARKSAKQKSKCRGLYQGPVLGRVGTTGYWI